MRKPISISESNGEKSVCCDDGSMWTNEGVKNRWIRLPNIPQDLDAYQELFNKKINRIKWTYENIKKVALDDEKKHGNLQWMIYELNQMFEDLK